MHPTLGRVVLYTLSEQDAGGINHRRKAAAGPYAGNVVHEGDTFPATVVRTWPGDLVNLQVTLDGPDALWATSVGEGSGPRTWAWPPRV